MTTYTNGYDSTEFMDRYKKRNSPYGKMKRKLGETGEATREKFNNQTKPLRETLGKFNKESTWGKTKMLGSGLRSASPVIASAIEGYNAYDDINSGHLTTNKEKYNRAAESVTRLGGMSTGALVGSALGPWGSAIGGTAGLFAPEAIEAIAKGLGVEGELPSDKVSRLKQEKLGRQKVASALKADGGGDALDVEPRSGELWKPQEFPMLREIQGRPKLAEVQPQTNQTIDNSQTQVNAQLANLMETLKAPADADTIGDAVAQKSRNKTAMQLLQATLQGTGANNQGQLAQNRIRLGDQNIAVSKQNQQLTDQKIKLGGHEIEQKQQLANTLAEFRALDDKTDKDGSKRRALQQTLLTMMGKQPDSPYKFMKVNDGVNGEQIVVANAQTGEVQGSGQEALPQYEDGQIINFSDGKKMRWDAEKKRAVDV